MKRMGGMIVAAVLLVSCGINSKKLEEDIARGRMAKSRATPPMPFSKIAPEELKAFRNIQRESIEVIPGTLVYADGNEYSDAEKSSGKATGHVFVVFGAGWENTPLKGASGLAQSAEFDLAKKVLTIRGFPRLEGRSTIALATEATTYMSFDADRRLKVFGPSRTDLDALLSQPQ